MIPISALAHYSYCPRRCALVHLEAVWEENLFTFKGREDHGRVDQKITRKERGKTIYRALPVWSETWDLSGVCDVVELDETGTMRPVEYKSGRNRGKAHPSLQAAAQALCLEEMFGVTVPELGLYFLESKERVNLPFDEHLRDQVISVIKKVQALMESQRIPDVAADRRCPNCSILDACQPYAVQAARLGQSPFRLRPDKELP